MLWSDSLWSGTGTPVPLGSNLTIFELKPQHWLLLVLSLLVYITDFRLPTSTTASYSLTCEYSFPVSSYIKGGK
jgi:hypothetical protein